MHFVSNSLERIAQQCHNHLPVELAIRVESVITVFQRRERYSRKRNKQHKLPMTTMTYGKYLLNASRSDVSTIEPPGGSIVNGAVAARMHRYRDVDYPTNRVDDAISRFEQNIVGHFARRRTRQERLRVVGRKIKLDAACRRDETDHV